MKGIVAQTARQMEFNFAVIESAADHCSPLTAIRARQETPSSHFFLDVIDQKAFNALIESAVLSESGREQNAVIVRTNVFTAQHFPQIVLVFGVRLTEHANGP